MCQIIYVVLITRRRSFSRPLFQCYICCCYITPSVRGTLQPGRVSSPEVFLVTHLHPGLAQHGHALGVLQPQGGLQKLEGLTGILLVDGLDLGLETVGKQEEN